MEKLNLYEKNIAIAMLARDCEQKIENNLYQISQLFPLTKQCDVIIIENDSKDNTKEIIFKWKKKFSNIDVISLDNTFNNDIREGSSGSRIERMCFYRNKYLEYFKNKQVEYDYLIIIDADIDYFNYTSIINSISFAPKDWTAIFSNGRFYFELFHKRLLSRYYDNFAFVSIHNNNIQLTFNEIKLNNDYICKNLKKHSFLECKSAFGGIGIYKYSLIKDLRYKAIKNDRSEYYDYICEHIAFNDKINGKKFIAKDLVVYYSKISFIEFIKGVLISQKFSLFFMNNILRKKIIR